MRYAIFADIHSNLEAYIVVLEAYKKQLIDKYICLGDIAGYSASPLECINLTKKLGATVVAGNHDQALTGKLGLSWFNTVAQQSIMWTEKVLGQKEISYLSSFDLVYSTDNFVVVHSSLDKPEQFQYLTGIDEAQDSFERLTKQILFVGHSHIPEVFIKSPETIEHKRAGYIELSSDCKYIVNVGSVGQPRDRDWRACFCIYDSGKKTIDMKRIEYDVKSAQTKIVNAGLPTF